MHFSYSESVKMTLKENKQNKSFYSQTMKCDHVLQIEGQFQKNKNSYSQNWE